MELLLEGFCGGVAAGGVLLVVGSLFSRVVASAFVRDMTQVCVLGRTCSPREAQFIGAAVHLVLAGIFGAVFAVGVAESVVTGYGVLPLSLYAIILTLVMGGVVVPLEGHGLFGVKADRWFPLDLVVTNVLWVGLYGVFMMLLT